MDFLRAGKNINEQAAFEALEYFLLVKIDLNNPTREFYTPQGQRCYAFVWEDYTTDRIYRNLKGLTAIREFKKHKNLAVLEWKEEGYMHRCMVNFLGSRRIHLSYYITQEVFEPSNPISFLEDCLALRS